VIIGLKDVEGDKLIITSFTSETGVLEINRDSGDNISLYPLVHMDTEPRLWENILNIKQEEEF
jgi:hypothetical protein